MECKCRNAVKSRTCNLILIETYWNVNAFDPDDSVFYALHINRDILECKSDCTDGREAGDYYINRDILECKLVLRPSESAGLLVY